MGLLRVATYGAVATGALGLLAAGRVYGDVAAVALALGGELGRLGDIGAGEPLSLNGQPIFVASSSTGAGVAAILDGAEGYCRGALAGFGGDLESLEARLRRPDEGEDRKAPASTRLGVLRREGEGRGVVACVVPREGASAGLGPFTGRFAAFAESGDLGDLGRLRYVYVERQGERSHVIKAWTEGAFDLRALLPGSGDAAGSDPASAPRPARSVRLLTAAARSAPYGVRIYESGVEPGEVIADYDAAMPGLGWKFAVPPERLAPSSRVYARPGAELFVFAGKEGERTVVSLVESRAR